MNEPIGPDLHPTNTFCPGLPLQHSAKRLEWRRVEWRHVGSRTRNHLFEREQGSFRVRGAHCLLELACIGVPILLGVCSENE
jgi:hypothetical protein